MKVKDILIIENYEENDIYNNNLILERKNLTSLKGIPKEINGDFNCSFNNLITLENSPEIVNGYFDCTYNKLKSLKGRPKKIKGSFDCSNNPELKNVKDQIIKYQIKANYYFINDNEFSFEKIQKEFKEYGNYLKTVEKDLELKNNTIKKNLEKQEKIKQTKTRIKIDYGLSLT